MDSHIVEQLWQKHIEPINTREYLCRYNSPKGRKLEAVLGKGIVESCEFPRLVEIMEFRRLLEKHAVKPKHVLMYNGGKGGDPELRMLNGSRVTSIDYNPVSNENDMHTFQPSASFDFILFSQTLEHLYNPLQALLNLRGWLESGGMVWTSVPTINRQHQLPFNFITGLTPIGLAVLFVQAGFEVIEVGQWGNPKYANHVIRFKRWPTYYDLKAGFRKSFRFKIHPRYWLGTPLRDLLGDGTKNDFDTPVQCWILARKP